MGVAAVYAAFSLIAGVSAMALAIDIGQLYYAQRDLEKLAGAAALDATRAASGCFVTGGGAPPTSSSAITAAVAASIQRNLDISAAKDLTKASDFMQPISGVNTVEIGMLDNMTVPGVRTFTPTDGAGGLDNKSTDAIRVNLARIQPTPLIPFIFSTATSGTGPGLLRASASSQQTPMASYTIGTSLTMLSPPFLNPIFGLPGTGLNLSLADFQGLASVDVNLGDIAVNLGLAQPGANGGPGTLSSTALNTPISQLDFLNAVANSLSAEGQGAAAATVSQIATVVGTAPPAPGQPPTLGSIIGQTASALPVNTFDLLTAAAGDFNSGLFPLKLAPIVGVPGLAGTAIYVTVGDPARPASGRAGLKADGSQRTFANTAQVTLQIRQSLNVAGLSTLKLGTDVTVASARSFLSGVQCPSGVNQTAQPIAFLDVTTAPATVAVGTFNDARPTDPVTSGALLSVTIPIVGTVKVSTAGIIPATQLINTSHQVVQFSGPYPNSQTVGGDVGGLDIGAAVADSVSKLSLQACLTTILTGTTCQTVLAGGTGGGIVGTLGTLVIQPVLATLAPAVSALDSTVDGVLTGLGAQVGPASVNVASLVYRGPNTAVAGDTNSIPRLFNLDTTVVANGASTR
jgi:uncharacterized membrane protein